MKLIVIDALRSPPPFAFRNWLPDPCITHEPEDRRHDTQWRYRAGMIKKSYETRGRNVFVDLGAPNAEEHFLKAKLVLKIDMIHGSGTGNWIRPGKGAAGKVHQVQGRHHSDGLASSARQITPQSQVPV